MSVYNTFYFVSPMTGTLLDLSAVPDPAFSEKMLGDGFAVDLSGGKITAPFDGVVSMVFPTGHAIALTDGEGREVLIHIGIDTVNLKGEGFKVHVEKGQVVFQNDLLLEVDLEKIKSAKSMISPVIFTSGVEINLKKEKQAVVNGEDDLFVLK